MTIENLGAASSEIGISSYCIFDKLNRANEYSVKDERAANILRISSVCSSMSCISRLAMLISSSLGLATVASFATVSANSIFGLSLITSGTAQIIFNLHDPNNLKNKDNITTGIYKIVCGTLSTSSGLIGIGTIIFLGISPTVIIPITMMSSAIAATVFYSRLWYIDYKRFMENCAIEANDQKQVLYTYLERNLYYEGTSLSIEIDGTSIKYSYLDENNTIRKGILLNNSMPANSDEYQIIIKKIINQECEKLVIDFLIKKQCLWIKKFILFLIIGTPIVAILYKSLDNDLENIKQVCSNSSELFNRIILDYFYNFLAISILPSLGIDGAYFADSVSIPKLIKDMYDDFILSLNKSDKSSTQLNYSGAENCDFISSVPLERKRIPVSLVVKQSESFPEVPLERNLIYLNTMAHQDEFAPYDEVTIPENFKILRESHRGIRSTILSL